MTRTPEQPDSRSPRPGDPFELWRQIYETNERAWNAVLERTVNNPTLAESSGKILETFQSAQRTVRENMKSYLEGINLPSRDDVARLSELIVTLDKKVDQLDGRLARIESRLVQAKAAPPAATTPPKAASTTAAKSTSRRAPSTGN